MTDRPDSTDPFALLARWRATTPAESVAASEPEQANPAQVLPEEQPRSPEDHLAAIADGARDVVPPETLATFLAPIREALANPPAERDPVALALALDRLEDLLEAFLLAGCTKASEVPP